MKAPRTRIAQVVADQTLQHGVSRKLSRELAAYLLSEGRVDELDSVLRDVQVDWAAAGYVEVIASSAHPLTATIRASITKRVKQLYPAAKRIIIAERCDPDVLAGVRLSLANQQLDLTAEAKLNTFRELTNAGN